MLTLSLGARAEQRARPGTVSGPVRVVRAGDTLWAVARGIVGAEGDPRPVVARLRAINGIEPGSLRPGMTLRLPAG